MNPRARRSYDHRIRAAVVATGNPCLFPNLHIPRATARTWIRRGMKKVVAAADDGSGEVLELRAEVADLRRKAETYFAIAAVLLVVTRVLGANLRGQRQPEASAKAQLLRVISRASRHVSANRVLRLIGLSTPRYHAWKRRSLSCRLEDEPSCPRSQPTRLTAVEVQAIKADVVSPELRHVSVRGLALLAQRKGRVAASASTWHRLIRERGWRRPRKRLYPARPKIGVRATGPNEWWHIDLTVLRLASGARVYLHAVIDNYSRRVLAWEVAERVTGRTTRGVIDAATRLLGEGEVSLMADSGVENVNATVEEYLAGSPIKRILAQVEVVQSNSMIEAFWRSLRHQWLYLHELGSIGQVREAGQFLRGTAQQRDAPRGLRGADTRRDVLRNRCGGRRGFGV
jgi:transposase InsO family protein